MLFISFITDAIELADSPFVDFLRFITFEKSSVDWLCTVCGGVRCIFLGLDVDMNVQ